MKRILNKMVIAALLMVPLAHGMAQGPIVLVNKSWLHVGLKKTRSLLSSATRAVGNLIKNNKNVALAGATALGMVAGVAVLHKWLNRDGQLPFYRRGNSFFVRTGILQPAGVVEFNGLLNRVPGLNQNAFDHLIVDEFIPAVNERRIEPTNGMLLRLALARITDHVVPGASDIGGNYVPNPAYDPDRAQDCINIHNWIRGMIREDLRALIPERAR